MFPDRVGWASPTDAVTNVKSMSFGPVAKLDPPASDPLIETFENTIAASARGVIVPSEVPAARNTAARNATLFANAITSLQLRSPRAGVNTERPVRASGA